MNKLLILLIFFANTAFAEDIVYDEGIIENVLVTLHIMKDKEALNKALCDLYKEAGEDDEELCEPVDGFSSCFGNVLKNIAWCDVYILKPTKVDDNNILTFGHEVWHGVAGTEYHE